MKLAGANPLGHFGYWAAATVIVVMGWTLYGATLGTREASLRVDRTLQAIEDVSRINEAVSRPDAARPVYFITRHDFSLVGPSLAAAGALPHPDHPPHR